MRISLLILLLSAGTLCAQDIILRENFENVTLEWVLKKISKDHNVKIAFDNQIAEKIIITQRLDNVPLDEALALILSGSGLTYHELNGKVIIIPSQVKNEQTATHRQSFNISGVIKDEETGETLPNATIHLTGTNNGTTSNTDGFFTLVDIPHDSSSISIHYLGYISKQIRLEGIVDLSHISVPLQSDRRVLEVVTVTDQYESPFAVTEEISKSAFDPKALTSLPSLGEHDVFRTLQLLPGVSGTNESSAGLVVRGSIPSQNLILLDGFTIYHLDHFFGVFSAINADFIKDVQLFKGGFEAKYGGRVSGVVDITGKSGSSTHVKGNFGINLVSTNATIEVPVGSKVSLLFSTRRAYSDLIQSSLYKKLFNISRNNDEQIKRPFENATLDAIEPSFYFYDFNSKVTYRPSRKDNIALSIYGGKDNLSGEKTDSIADLNNEISFQETLTEKTEWGNNGISLRWGRQWNGKFYTNLKISGSNFFRTYDFNYQYKLDSTNFSQVGDVDFIQENRVDDSNLAIDHEWLISEKITLEFGLSGMEYKIHYKTAANDQIAGERNDKGNVGSVYTTAKIKLTKKLNASIGIRSNHHEINQEWYNEPRLSLNFKVNNRFNLKSAIGRYYQFVNHVQYDDPYNGIQNFWAFSNNEGVPVVRSDHYILGASYRAGQFLFDIEAYYKNLEGVVEFNPVPYFVKDGFLDQGLFANGRGRMSGIDFLLQKEVGIYKGWLGYSWSQSLQSFANVNDGAFYPSIQDQPHEIKFVNMLKLGPWDLSSSWVYGSGRPYPNYKVTYFVDAEGNVEDFVVTKDGTSYNRLPAYHRLDIAAAYNFSFGKMFGQVGLSIFNVYGHENIKTRKLSVPFLERTLQTPDQPLPEYRDLVLISFTPSVFLNVGF